MKGAFLTAAAALVGSALADGHMRRHGHEALHRRHNGDESCGCTTKVITYYGNPTCRFPPGPEDMSRRY